MKLKHLISGFIALAIAASGLFVPAAAVGNSDATLSSFDIMDNDYGTQMSPGFDSVITSYAFALDNKSFDLSANATDENASVEIVEGSSSESLPRDTYTTIEVEPGIHDFDVIVTAEDGTTTQTYSLRVAASTALTPIVHGISQDEVSVLGGERVTITLENWTNVNYYNGWYNNDCWNSFYIGENQADRLYSYVDSETGYIKHVLRVPSTTLEPGSKADLTIESGCYFYSTWEGYDAETTYPETFTYLPYELESSQVPDVMYPGGSFTLSGFGFTYGMDISARFVDPSDPTNYISISRWGYSGNDNVQFYHRLYRDLGYEGPADIEIYDCSQGESCDYDNPIFTDTVDIRQAIPSNITFTPGSMNTNGGKEVVVTGRYLYLGEDDPDFYLGDIELSSESMSLAYEGDYSQYSAGIDRYTVTMPEDLAPGEYTLSVKNENDHVGEAAAKFVVGAKPVISAVSPTSVANVGGSVITITGESFGTRGTPTVTINGTKALNVKRVSATKVLATVPALGSTTGAVNVIVVSPQSGGASEAASLTVAAASVNPTISSLSVTTGVSTGGTEIIISGTNLGSLATTGITLGGKVARIVTASATSVKIQSPAAAAGSADLIVSTPTGQVTSARAFTYTAAPAITSLSNRTFASSTSVEEAILTITGVGFGASGTIKIGDDAAIAYTSTNGGTTIENISVAGQPVGRIPVVVTPQGAAKPLTTSFTITGPSIDYVGSNDYNSNFLNANVDYWERGAVFNITTGTSSVVRIEGAGFGDTAGQILIGDTVVEVSAWERSVITFEAPDLPTGSYSVTVVPAVGPSTARAVGLIYVDPVVRTVILRAEATVWPTPNLNLYSRNHFNPLDTELSNRYQVIGSGFLGTDNGATTTVLLADTESNEAPYANLPIDVISLTDTEIIVDLSRETAFDGYKSIRVITDAGEAFLKEAIWYTASNETVINQYRYEGACIIDDAGLVGADGFFYVDSNREVFGESGTITIGDSSERISLTPGLWTSSSISVYFDAQTAELANPYGQKTIIITPDDSTLVKRTFNFNCAVWAEYDLKINGVDGPVTQSARDAYTVSAVAIKDVYSDSPITIPDTAYEYMTVESYDSLNYWSPTPGLPKAVGHYYIRLNGWHDSVVRDTNRYYAVWANEAVELTLTGSAVTLTPTLVGGGNTIEYRGQLGDGTNGTQDDFDFTQSTTADAITGVTWEYRDHLCETNGYGPNVNWYQGLPNFGAHQEMCGGNGTVASSWDIRIASVTMDSSGTDQSIYYQLNREVFNLTITPKAVTLVPRNMDKAYDGNNYANFWFNWDFDGAIESYTPYLDYVEAYFDDELPGVNKTVTPSTQLKLGGGWEWYYTLTNPDATFTATIFKASAYMKLEAAGAVTLDSGSTVDITVSNIHLDNGNDVSGAQDIAPVVLVSATPAICTLDGTTVTPLAAGECVIEATQAASTYFNAGVAYSDNDLNVETLTIIVVGTPVALNVIADDITIPIGDSFEPSVQVLGAFGDDTVDGIEFEYYLDGVLVDGTPTERGVYTIVPKGGNVNAYDASAYDLEGTVYTAGTLTITGLPPTILSVEPASGPTVGGNTMTINGYELDLVTMIMIGETVYEPEDFVVSADGNQITLVVAPGEVGTVDLVIYIDDASVTETYTYIASDVPDTESVLDLKLELAFDSKLKGSKATISGGGLKTESAYTLEMHSTPILIYAGTTDVDGNFVQQVTIPAGVCVTAGQHELILTGIAPDGSVKTATQWLWIDSNCFVQERSKTGPITKASIGKILFAYRSAVLTKKAKQTLWALMPLMRNSKTIEVFGYTQTQNKSAASKKANILLAKKRTYAIAKFLKYVGIKAKVVVRPKGPVQPISNWQKYNRRVELTIKL